MKKYNFIVYLHCTFTQCKKLEWEVVVLNELRRIQCDIPQNWTMIISTPNISVF